MNCPHCNEAITESDFNCPACGKLTATTREDLNRIDTRSSKGISWALIGMGVFGYVFVIANSWTEWFSALDFVAPTALLFAGIAGLMWVNKQN